MADFETGVRRFQQEIINCIKEPTIVSLLEAASVISIEDSGRIKILYLHGHTYEAGKDMLECVYNSEQPGKWGSFVDALGEAEFPFLKRLVSSPDNAYELSSLSDIRAKISAFTPWLVKNIIAGELVSKLVFSKVMNNVDAEFIRSTLKNQGNTNATIALLQRMQCRVSPKKWYYEFLDALLSTGFEMIVGKLEPDFLTNPSAFMPELAQRFDVEVESCDLTKLCGIQGKMTLLLGNSDISFEDPKTKRVQYSFLLTWIRRFGTNKAQLFKFEVGRKCPNGEGSVTCKTPSAKAIYKLVTEKSSSRSKSVIPHSHVEGETTRKVSEST